MTQLVEAWIISRLLPQCFFSCEKLQCWFSCGKLRRAVLAAASPSLLGPSLLQEGSEAEDMVSVTVLMMMITRMVSCPVTHFSKTILLFLSLLF